MKSFEERRVQHIEEGRNLRKNLAACSEISLNVISAEGTVIQELGYITTPTDVQEADASAQFYCLVRQIDAAY